MRQRPLGLLPVAAYSALIAQGPIQAGTRVGEL
jgi:hypothetical protein